MYPTENLKHGQLKFNQFPKNLDPIMIKTLQNFYTKTNAPFNMTSPFLVDNILHQQKNDFHNHYINQQLENYVLQRQNYQSRDNSPEIEENKDMEDETRNDDNDDTKIDDEDSKSRDDETFPNVKNEYFHAAEFYSRNEEIKTDKEIINIPNLSRRCQNCGLDCPPFACKKTGLSRLEELEKRFNFRSFNDNSGDEADKEKYSTEEMVKSCEDFEQKKPLLKFSVSAILGDREDSGSKNSGINGK